MALNKSDQISAGAYMLAENTLDTDEEVPYVSQRSQLVHSTIFSSILDRQSYAMDSFQKLSPLMGAVAFI